MYFFTEPDPNYRIQGSRDPLGFQVVWQRVARKLIKYLSTVSSNIRDFQTLCYAYYLYEDRDPKGFIDFFIKFEQICAYSRGIYLTDINEGFNGIEFVTKNKDNNPINISRRPRYTILSNQKVYGIWGKYNRPFSDIGLNKLGGFADIMRSAINKTKKKSELQNLVDEVVNKKELTIDKTKLIPISEVLSSITEEERSFFRDSILKVENDDNHLQNTLYNCLLNNPDILSYENFDFRQLTSQIIHSSEFENLSELIREIQFTDIVLLTHTAVFRTLQSRSSWTYQEINDHPLLSNIPDAVDHNFIDEELNEFNSVLENKNNSKSKSMEIIDYLIDRNKEVCELRNNVQWLVREDDRIRINYNGGAKEYEKINSESDYEYDYFLSSYCRLFKQIEHSK